MRKTIHVPKGVVVTCATQKEAREKIIQYAYEQGVIAERMYTGSVTDMNLYVEGETGGLYDHSDMD